jgi:hypothetical protein
VPCLTSPTKELFDHAAGYLSLLTEYLASFTLAQLSLKMADQSLVLVDAAAARVFPESKGRSFIRQVHDCEKYFLEVPYKLIKLNVLNSSHNSPFFTSHIFCQGCGSGF